MKINTNTTIADLQAQLASIGATGFEVDRTDATFRVTVFGHRAGAPVYARKSKQADGYSKSLAVALNRAVEEFMK